MKRPRGTFIVPRTEVDLAFSLPGSQEEISARGVVVHDVVAGSFRRTGRPLHRRAPRARAADRRLLPPALIAARAARAAMPELPEVEVAARNLRRWALGRKVRAVRADRRAAAHPAARRRRGRSGALAGARFEEVRRRGKNLLVTLARPGRRAGRRLVAPRDDGEVAAPPRRRAQRRGSRACASISTTAPACTTRTCGCSAASAWCPTRASRRCADIAALGPDPLDDGIDVDRLARRLARTRLPIKVAILDQTLLPGIGNIQASEGLFRAGIDPRRPARSLSRAELARLARGLLESIRYTLKTFKQQRRRRRRRRHRLRRGAQDPEPVPGVRAGRASRARGGARQTWEERRGRRERSCGSCRRSGRRSICPRCQTLTEPAPASGEAVESRRHPPISIRRGDRCLRAAPAHQARARPSPRSDRPPGRGRAGSRGPPGRGSSRGRVGQRR